MRIGVNALYLIPGGVGGTEIYLRSLLQSLAEIDSSNEYVVFTNRETGTSIVPGGPNFRVKVQPVRAAIRPARILWEQMALPLAAAPMDVLLNPGFTAPIPSACPNVTVFHDLQHKRHPEHFRWFDLPFWRMLLYGSAHRSRRLIAVSETTRDDLLSFYKLDPAIIHVVHHGVDSEFFRIAESRAPERIILCVSTLHPHKNLDRLIHAFTAAQLEGWRLVITGLRGFYAAELEALARGRENVELTGWLPREGLYDLFRRASAFVFPSTFEGFGMPVLESMAAGIPTACSQIEPLVSIAGGAALHFPPDSEQAITEALQRITGDEALRAQLASAGRERAASFSWTECARKTLAVLREAAT